MKYDPNKADGIVVHYHEIALKGGNRPFFLRQLIDNLERSTAGLGVKKIQAPRGRIVIRLDRDADREEIRHRLCWTFGIANFSLSWSCPLSFPKLSEDVRSLVSNQSFASFRIAARRGDKRYPLTSMDLNERLGRLVQDEKKARVDLTNPEITIHVEITPKETWVYFDKTKGPGGLPIGVSGHVFSLLSGGFDSPVASYLMMKRGCHVQYIHFHGHPFLSKASLEKAEELVEVLTRAQIRSTLHSVAFGEIQRRIVLTAPPPLRVVLYRRLMLRIANEIAYRNGGKALITGESLGQVASQTLENIVTIQEASELPVLRPLIGWDKQEIIQLAREIGTYTISAQPDQDCCRLFVPPHPSVRSGVEEVRKIETRLPIDDLVKLGLESLEVHSIDSEEGKPSERNVS